MVKVKFMVYLNSFCPLVFCKKFLCLCGFVVVVLYFLCVCI